VGLGVGFGGGAGLDMKDVDCVFFSRGSCVCGDRGRAILFSILDYFRASGLGMAHRGDVLGAQSALAPTYLK